MNMMLTIFVKLPDQTPNAGLQMCATVPSFYVDGEELNSSLYAFTVRTLHTVPSPQLSISFICSNGMYLIYLLLKCMEIK